jgi:predicted metal-dependent hydrolase
LADYIIAHELVHLVEGHHGPAFWEALGRARPEWQKRKDALGRQAKDYLVFGLHSPRNPPEPLPPSL